MDRLTDEQLAEVEKLTRHDITAALALLLAEVRASRASPSPRPDLVGRLVHLVDLYFGPSGQDLGAIRVEFETALAAGSSSPLSGTEGHAPATDPDEQEEIDAAIKRFGSLRNLARFGLTAPPPAVHVERAAPAGDAAFRSLLDAYGKAERLYAYGGSKEASVEAETALAAVESAHRDALARAEEQGAIAETLRKALRLANGEVESAERALAEAETRFPLRDIVRERKRAIAAERERNEARATASRNAGVIAELLHEKAKAIEERDEARAEVRRLMAELGIEKLNRKEERDRLAAEIDGLRPEVLAFARVMHAKIEGHNHDRGEYGWRTATPVQLLGWLEDYVTALSHALDASTADAVLGKAANVANLAMMIADVLGVLAPRSSPGALAPAPPAERPTAATRRGDWRTALSRSGPRGGGAGDEDRRGRRQDPRVGR